MSPKLPQEERRKRLLNDPTIYNKVQEAAASLTKQFGPQAQVLVDIPLKSEFIDIETGQRYTYEGLTTPYPHSDIVGLISEVAQQPLDILKDASYFVISEVLGARRTIVLPGEDKPLPTVKGQNLLIAGRDFIKYFAFGKWKLVEQPVKIDPDEFAQEKDVLRPI
jgi:hypothetical protein